MRKLFTLILFAIPLLSFSQKGTIRGLVYDDKTGETLVGVTVIVPGTTLGTITDLDGMFTIEVNAGLQELQLSYISYDNLNLKEIQVKPGEVTYFENLRMKESSMDLQEVVITAEVVRTTEVALQTVKRKSAVMMDGISSRKMKLIGDATAVEAAKRVTGVSIEGGKYVYVRGLGDRYTKTTLNGVNIPGLDPDKNSLQMDLIPTNLINNMIVLKNFTADLPADFTGGLMDVETKDFPARKIKTLSLGVAYNPAMHFNSNYLTYKGGVTDFLGFDDGTRSLPDGSISNNIPTPISGANQQTVNDYISSFNSQLGAIRQMSFMDFSASYSYGNQISLPKKDGEEPKLGYIFSASYKSDYKYYDDVQYGEYQKYQDPTKTDLRFATSQIGELGEHNVLVGLLGGIAYKTKLTKYKLMLMHLQNGESRAGKFEILNDGEAVGQSGYYAKSDNLEYNQRSLSNILLSGSHLSEDQKWEIDWKLSPAFSTSIDPDIRKTAFTYTNVDTLFMAGAGGNPSRIWRSLYELNATAKIDVTRKYEFIDLDAKFKFGASQTFKYRSYGIRLFNMQFFGAQNWTSYDANDVLNPENLYPNKPNSVYYQSGNNYPDPNMYESNIQNSAMYVSNEMYITPLIKSIIGVRAEYYVQRHTGRDQLYANGDIVNGKNLDNEVVLESIDLFPSVNLIYSYNEKQNVRMSYTKTIARPSFKELSFAQILDPISNRIFNGSLFTYSDWDGNLTETRIDNFDLRWELFPKGDELFSISAFYKKFNNPIELVRIPEQQTSTEYQPRNVGDGRVYGLEFELRKSLEFISEAFSNFSMNANVTLVESQIDMTDAEYNSRLTFEKEGENIQPIRQMAGQSPYVINAGLSYINNDKGISAGVFYNVKGRTLTIVGGGLFPDIYSEPINSLNMSFGKSFGKDEKSSLSVKVSNILNEKIESYYRAYQAAPMIYSSYNPGVSISIGYSYKF